MANTTKTDSPISRRIVLSFLDFLNSVEPAPGVDLEALEVAKDCLSEVFKLNSSSVDDDDDDDDDDDRIKPHSLVDIFSSLDVSEQQPVKSDSGHREVAVDAPPSSSSVQNVADANVSEASKLLVLTLFHALHLNQGDDWTSKSSTLGVSKDELLGQYFAALEKINFLKTSADGHDDPVQLDKATHIFHDALTEMERSGCQTYNRNNLADSLKMQGNKAMQSKCYSDAIELYTCAITLCESNAVYYCNRAAAFTQIHKYNEAIRDSHKSIEIDPSYSKAYSRLGLAYYAQGNYDDAINRGFKKALQLDPTNESVKENIRVAELKLKEERQRAERDQNSGSASYNNQGNQSTGGSRTRATPPPFTSMSFDTTALPADIASMFTNMAANAYPERHSQERSQNSTDVDGPDEPEIRIGGNINLNFGDQMPEDLSGALRSVMDMLSGAAPHPQGNPQDDSSRRSTPN